MKLLLIEDDRTAADYVATGLRESGHSVDHAADGAEGLTLALATRYDVIVADRMLPYMDGLAVVQALRAQGVATPILILSALAKVDDRVKGQRAGGDDYLTKPFAFSELLARIEVLSRRAAAAEPSTRLKVADLEMDLVGRKLTREERIPIQKELVASLERCRHYIHNKYLNVELTKIQVEDIFRFLCSDINWRIIINNKKDSELLNKIMIDLVIPIEEMTNSKGIYEKIIEEMENQNLFPKIMGSK